MSAAAFFRNESGELSPFWRFAFIIATFLFVWPPIFGSVGWWMKFDFGPPLLGWVITIAIYSYVIFAPSALVAGIVHAVAAIRFHNNSILVPLVAAGSAPILNLALIFGIVPGQYPINMLTENYVVVLVASLIASLICWRLTRGFARMA